MTTTSSIRAPRYRVPIWLIYWTTQLSGWGLYIALFQFVSYFEEKSSIRFDVAMLQYCMGVGISHVMRRIILRNKWLERDIGSTLPRLILTSALLSVVAYLIEKVALLIMVSPDGGFHWDFQDHLGRIINWTLLFSIWGFAYFAYNYFIRHRREEIRNLRLETANRENQLSTLRAQLNPHFMFNALNGIRALIDEDPARAKQAITQLSSILRNAMATVKRRTVPLGEELDIVKAYLELERMRFEERLRTRFEVDPALEREPVPPMLLQTLVENAVRHGIARLTEGGEVVVGAQRGVNGIVLSVRNSGEYTPGQVNGSGIGLAGTRKRLAMIYGESAALHISNRDGMVVTEVELPAQDTSLS